MKRILVILLTITSLNVLGQEHLIGFQGGVNFSNITSPDSYQDSKFRTCFLGGLNYEYRFKTKLTLGADLLYRQQGFSSEVEFTNGDGTPMNKTAKFKDLFNYLSVPVKIGYTVGNKVKGFAKIGVCPSVLLQAEAISPIVDINGNTTRYETVKTTNNLSKFDLGGLLEVGASYGFKNSFELFGAATYNKSLTTVTNKNYFDELKVSNYGFSFSVGLKYKLKQK